MSTITETITPFLLCQASKVPLTNAVCVVPCNDKIQEGIAKAVFGEPLENGWKTAKGFSCPVCHQPVKGYMIDHTTRSIARAFFGMEKNLNPIPYPGKPANFIHVLGDWTFFKPDHDLCKYMEFRSHHKEALIQKIYFLGFVKGNVKIMLEYAPSQADKLEKFFKSFSDLVYFSRIEKQSGFYRTLNTGDLKVVFEVIKANNTFPVDYLSKVEAIIAEGIACKSDSSTSEDFEGEGLEDEYHEIDNREETSNPAKPGLTKKESCSLQ